MSHPLLLTLLLGLAGRLAFAAPTFPAPSGFVNDFAGVLRPETIRTMNAALADFERRTRVEVAFVTLPSLTSDPVESVAVALFKEWGIGKKGHDNGLLLLIAPTERQLHIEVGYGLEAIVPDAVAGRIIRDTIVPRLKAGDIDAGCEAGIAALLAAIEGKGTATAGDGRGTNETELPVAYYLLAIIICTVLFNTLRRRRSFVAWTLLAPIGYLIDGWPFALFLLIVGGFFVALRRFMAAGAGGSSGGGFSGGGFSGVGGFGGGGGFGGFGGGHSGGGGASGRW